MRSTVGISLLPAQAVAEGQGGGGCQAADMAANKKFVRISRKSFEVANKPLLSCFS